MEYINQLIMIYKPKGLLEDTNLLLLYFIGAYDPERISRFKRTMAFTIDEFLLLAMFLGLFEKIITTPNILTEVSNLSGQLPENLRAFFWEYFAGRMLDLQESYTPSTTISASPHFTKFGLTDSGIVGLVKDKYLVLTDDLKLAAYLQNLDIDVINFNHIRAIAW